MVKDGPGVHGIKHPLPCSALASGKRKNVKLGRSPRFLPFGEKLEAFAEKLEPTMLLREEMAIVEDEPERRYCGNTLSVLRLICGSESDQPKPNGPLPLPESQESERSGPTPSRPG